MAYRKFREIQDQMARNNFDGQRLGFSNVTIPTTSRNKVSVKDIENVVQHLVEWCLQLYMTEDEVVQTLWTNATVEPIITTLVWERMVQQNYDFFKHYYARLELISQIKLFNKLLERQAHEMKRLGLLSEPAVSNLIHPLPDSGVSGPNVAFTPNVAGAVGSHLVPGNIAGPSQVQVNFNPPHQTSDFPNIGDTGAFGNDQIAPFSPSDSDVFDFSQLENTGLFDDTI